MQRMAWQWMPTYSLERSVAITVANSFFSECHHVAWPDSTATTTANARNAVLGMAVITHFLSQMISLQTQLVQQLPISIYCNGRSNLLVFHCCRRYGVENWHFEDLVPFANCTTTCAVKNLNVWDRSLEVALIRFAPLYILCPPSMTRPYIYI